MILWHPPDAANIAAPAVAAALLERAIAARPDDAALRLKVAHIRLDRYDFEGAASALEAALAIDPGFAGVRRGLALCYNGLRRPGEALDVLANEPPDCERALALEALGYGMEAEREYRAVLAAEPRNRPACRKLSKILRRSGRLDELLRLCERLSAAGVRHAQLLYVWGTALALGGRIEEARALLLDPARIAELALPVPDSFADIAAFNAALAEEILTNPYRLSEFPVEDEANRGSSRVHALLAGRRPELIRALLATIQDVVTARAPGRRGAFDPWADARPAEASFKAWGLIQRRSDYEEWHLHPGGWLSGVYYVQVPASVSAEGEGRGCIEFGPPGPVARAMPGLIPVFRHRPREGRLLLAPSHYPHRTIPTGSSEVRLSFAFDVVPELDSLL